MKLVNGYCCSRTCQILDTEKSKLGREFEYPRHSKEPDKFSPIVITVIITMSTILYILDILITDPTARMVRHRISHVMHLILIT